MDSRRQSIASDASTTLSSFVRKRFNGEIPIFGGDIRTGVTEAAKAVSNTVQTNMATALLAMSQALVTLDKESKQTLEPISMIDNEPNRSGTYTQEDLMKCAELDDDQVRLLLDASIVTTQQSKYFQTLIYATRDAIRKKKASVELNQLRKQSLLTIDYSLRDDELESLLGSKLHAIHQFAARMGIIEDMHVKLIERAFIHDSATGGRVTNRVLAMLGDASLSLMLRKQGYMHNVPVGRISHASQRTLSNTALRDVGIQAKLHHMIVVGPNVDPTSRTIVATTVEAIYGVMELIGGTEAVQTLNDNHLMVCDFKELF